MILTSRNDAMVVSRSGDLTLAWRRSTKLKKDGFNFSSSECSLLTVSAAGGRFSEIDDSAAGCDRLVGVERARR